MARPSKSIPSYRHHKKTGQAVVTVRKADGARTDVYLGVFNSSESHDEYQRVLALLRSNRGIYPEKKSSDADLTIAELAARYIREKVEVDYVSPDGAPTTEQGAIGQALKPLLRLFGSTIAREFDAQKLEAVQGAMVSGEWLTDEERATFFKNGRPIGRCRSNVNKHVSRIRALVKWAVRKKLVPVTVLVDIGTVEPIKRGRSKAREASPVLPVDPAIVEDTIPHLPPTVRDIVKVQLLTGARPGEILKMRVRDLDMSGPVWILKPSDHKTAHHGHIRAIAIGPKAQLILRHYLKPTLDAFLFSPREQAEIIRQEKRAKRKSKVQPSQKNRAKPNVKPVGERFTVRGYGRAVERACQRAGLDHWHPNQLRHATALLIEREHGAEAARAVLGHRTLNMTLHYSGIDQKRAAEVAKLIG